MNDEQTNETDTPGETPNTPLENSDEQYKLLKEKNNKIQEELIRGEKLKTETLLAGEGGGHIQQVELTAEELKKKKAGEFFKGTALGDAIEKVK